MGPDQEMETCDGGVVEFQSGWAEDNEFAFDLYGNTWEKDYRDLFCPVDGSPVQTIAEYFPDAGDDFVYQEPCNSSIAAAVVTECAAALVAEDHCCDLIGGDYCLEMQVSCEVDACAASGGDPSIISHYVTQLFTNNIHLVCDIPNVAALFSAQNVEEVVITLPPSVAPTYKGM